MYWVFMIIKECCFFLDIDECFFFNVCYLNVMCNNIVGSYNCKCNLGYIGDGKNCISVFFYFL